MHYSYANCSEKWTERFLKFQDQAYTADQVGEVGKHAPIVTSEKAMNQLMKMNEMGSLCEDRRIPTLKQLAKEVAEALENPASDLY